MNRRSYVWVMIVFGLLVIGAIVLRSHGEGGLLADWFRNLHGH